MDWVGDYQKKFEGNELIANLKSRKFYGKLVINFSGGSPHTSHIEMCVKPYATTNVGGADCTGSSTLKEGEDGT